VFCRIGPEPPLVTRETFSCRFWSRLPSPTIADPQPETIAHNDL
jgi:hypothetical protein